MRVCQPVPTFFLPDSGYIGWCIQLGNSWKNYQYYGEADWLMKGSCLVTSSLLHHLCNISYFSSSYAWVDYNIVIFFLKMHISSLSVLCYSFCKDWYDLNLYHWSDLIALVLYPSIIAMRIALPLRLGSSQWHKTRTSPVLKINDSENKRITSPKRFKCI